MTLALVVRSSVARLAAGRTSALTGRHLSTSARALGPSYTATAVASGAGRNGKISILSPSHELALAMPKELGGTGNGQNPETLFAGGYAACFLSALQLVARESKVKLPDDLAINADVTIANNGDGFELAVVLTGKSDKIDKAELEKLLHEAHKICPYSKATRNNIPVELKVA
ncbi:hypothetical protein OC861_000438 [Tilletia horrida]|nr:hypothetical protein OC861_000438 [Tilletia horrida]